MFCVYWDVFCVSSPSAPVQTVLIPQSLIWRRRIPGLRVWRQLGRRCYHARRIDCCKVYALHASSQPVTHCLEGQAFLPPPVLRSRAPKLLFLNQNVITLYNYILTPFLTIFSSGWLLFTIYWKIPSRRKFEHFFSIVSIIAQLALSNVADTSLWFQGEINMRIHVNAW